MTVIPNGVGRGLLARRPRGRGRLRARRSGRSSRGRTSRGSQEAARRLGVELRVVGAPGWGGVQARRAGWGGSPTRSSRALPRRACLVYPSLYEGFGLPDRGGDGVRDAGRHERGRRDRGDGRRCGGARRPATTPRRSPPASRRRWRDATSCAGLGLERARAFTGTRSARATADIYREVARMTPLVVIDADVLGRQRTGDETYVENLLRQLPAAAAGRAPLRGAHPAARSRPRRHRGRARAGPLPGAADGVVGAAHAATTCARRSPTSSTRCRSAARARRRHDPRPLVRARSVRDVAARPPGLQDRRAALGQARRARARRLGADEGRPRRAVRHSAGADHGHAARCRLRLLAR